MPYVLEAAGALGLYIHFPFCRGKCPYCHFMSVPFDDGLQIKWWEGLKREAVRRSRERLEFDTLYLGGGTPSLLAPDGIVALREMLAGHFWLAPREFTLEANPGTADAGEMRGWKGAGVTRLSVGVQSFDDRILTTLGRGYSAERAASFCRTAIASGFDAVGFDLMIGVPGETPEGAEKTLAETLRLKPDHVSLYILENVEGLPFEKVLARDPPDEDVVVGIYRRFQEELESAGLVQYEISNFARPGKESLHNLKYWRYAPFLGLGPSACSHIGNRRWCNERPIGAWSAALAADRAPEEEIVDLTPDIRAREALVFGLRLVEGVDVARFQGQYGIDVEAMFDTDIRELIGDGFLVRENGRLRIPPDKFLLSNQVFARFA